MSVTSSQLHPPSNWDHFEDICADLFALEWNYPQVVRHGRSGQRQKGVDIYGKQNGENAGVQCKGKRVWPPTQLTTSDIDKEIKEAKEFSPKLKTFIFATIAEDDVNIQRHVNTITEQHEKTGLFSVHVYGWGELTRRIKNHPTLLEKYFEAQTVPLIRADIRKSSDEILGAIERLQTVVASKEPSPAAPPTPASEPDIFRAGQLFLVAPLPPSLPLCAGASCSVRPAAPRSGVIPSSPNNCSPPPSNSKDPIPTSQQERACLRHAVKPTKP